MNYTISNPAKIGCYTQTGVFKSISAVQTSLKAEVICNFQMYDFKTGVPCYYLRLNGKVLANDGANYYGYGWNANDTRLTFATVADAGRFDNFAGCIGVVANGVAITRPSYPAEIGGSRGRTCIGTKANGDIVLYCWSDGSSGACTLEKLGAKMVALGCVNAVAYDGGGSAQCRTPAGNVISTRKVQNFLYFDLVDKPEVKPDANGCKYPEPMTTVKSGSRGDAAAWVQWYLNFRGYPLVDDGVFGAKSVAALRKYQQEHGLEVDGICGAATRKALLGNAAQTTVVVKPEPDPDVCPYVEPRTVVKKGARGESVRWVQWQLRKHGYDIEIDGDFGNLTLDAVKSFQKSAELTVDGICGDETKAALKGAKTDLNKTALSSTKKDEKNAKKQRDAMISFAEKQVGGLYVYGSQGQSDAATIDWSRKCFPNYTTAVRAERMKKYLKAHPGLRMFDCSGLIWAAIEDAGIEVVSGKHVTDSTAADLYNKYCVHISKGELKPGDLVFSAALDHVAMVVSDNRIAEAAGSDVGVVLNDSVDVRKVKSIYGPAYGANEYYTKNPWTKFGRFKCFVEAGL